MGTLTATADPGRGAILLAFTGATPGDRITRDGQPIRYPPISSAAGLVYDYEAQPGITHTYALSGAQAQGERPDTVTTGVALVHPTNPSMSQRVKVRDDNPNRWSAPGTVHEVMGRRDPIVTHTMRTYHSGQLVFWTPWSQRPDVIALFADGTPILINPAASCPLEYEWTWGELTAEKIDPTGASGIWWTYDYQRVTKAGGYVTRPDHLANSYAAVLADIPCHPTYDKLADPLLTGGANSPCGHATYQDLLTTVHPHGATP